MMIQFQTQVEYYENKIPVKIQIFITRGLYTLSTTNEISEIRSNLSVKIPVFLKRRSIAYSKLKLRISTDLSPKIAKLVDLYTLESPIASALQHALSESQCVQRFYPQAYLSLDSQKHQILMATNKHKYDLEIACAIINLFLKHSISTIYLVDNQELSLLLAKAYKSKYSKSTFIFNFYKNPEIINSLFIFLKTYQTSSHKLAFIGIENLPKQKQETLYQIIKHSIQDCLFFVKPCRCGNFLNNNKQCLCHSLIRSKNMDCLSGELISALDFNISFFESNSKSGMVITDFFYTTMINQLLDLENLTHKQLSTIYISTYLKSYIEDLYTNFHLQPSLIKSLVTFACILAYLRGRNELIFADLFDVINLQSNWYKYAKNSEFIQHRPLA